MILCLLCQSSSLRKYLLAFTVRFSWVGSTNIERMDRLCLFGRITDWKSQLRQVFSHTVVTISGRWIHGISCSFQLWNRFNHSLALVWWHRFSSLSSFSVRSRDYCLEFRNWTIEGTDSFGLSWRVSRDRLFQVLSLSGSWLHSQFFLSKLIWYEWTDFRRMEIEQSET